MLVGFEEPFGMKRDETKLLVFLFLQPMGNLFNLILFYENEFLTFISGSFEKSSGPYTTMKAIKSVTNKDLYGPFVATSPSIDANDFNFHVGNHSLFGDFYDNNNFLGIESIEVYLKTNTSFIVNVKGPRVKSEKEED
ncbi:hypothetical protein CQW23_14817 [Capsicum baccatum]|uniref:Jacalin-type lectin domain-containing protein n=1 Tax=Capsicum baccatum TaxID=33114 RepID=A0A2G2WKF8_CAPBA|nr:hypothetical protein CQW23_14817 [Capsicum baccatum]